MQYKFPWLALWLIIFVPACAQSPDRIDVAPAPGSPTRAVTQVASEPTAPPATTSPTPATGATLPAAVAASTVTGTDEYAAAREAMVREAIGARDIVDEAVLTAMRTVPRHEFVPADYLSEAYADHPLPIGHGQTISQPYVVALMTQAVGLKPDDRVLEIGTGSGYQAAVLAEIVDEVFSVEIIGPLADGAATVFARLGYENVTTQHADGYFGWQAEAPFDAIVVTAAPDHIPQPLVQQLKVGGRMIIPVGPVGGYQTLWLVTKVSADEVRTEDLGGVRFVPLRREER